MRKREVRLRWLTPMLLFPIFFFLGCAAAPEPVAREKSTPPDMQAPRTLAIFPFENNSVTDSKQYAPLSKGLSAMLITDLNNNTGTLQLIERDKIESLLKEIVLSQGGSVDESTAIRAGKILGAQSIAFGSFMVLGEQVRMDVRIIKVETGELIIAESTTGSRDDFMELESKLASKIANSLHAVFVPKTVESGSDIQAALVFSNGLEALDRGDTAQARRLFQKSIDLNPSFQLQVDKLEGVGL